MKMNSREYAGLSNLPTSMHYAARYKPLTITASKSAGREIPGIDNRWLEAYPRAEGKQVQRLERWNNGIMG